MNRFENWFCSTGFWRGITQEHLLPWVLSGADLGKHVLELGAGPGAATEELARRAHRVTSLEYSALHTDRLAARLRHGNVAENIVQGDAGRLPFAGQTFSSVIALLVLHHLPSVQQQEAALEETYRVLRRGGWLFAFEINDGWVSRVLHTRSTFVPVGAATLPKRLTAAGFSQVSIHSRGFGYSVRAIRPK